MKKYLLFALTFVSFAGMAATSETIIQTNSYWNGQPIESINIQNPKVTMLRITIPVGEKLVVHKHPILNVGYLTKGELTVHSEKGEKLVLKPGDPIVELVDVWHYGENTGSEKAEIIVVYVGEANDELSITK